MRQAIGQAAAVLTIGLLAGCGSDGPSARPPTTPVTAPAAAAPPRATDTSNTAPAHSWAVAITATVLADDGSEPFTLRSSYPVTFDAVDDPVIATLEATAPEPLLVIGGSQIFSGHLTGAGVLDVAGPVCVDAGTMFTSDFCSADPASVPIGISYRDVTAGKPTGPVLDSRYLRLALDAKRLQPGVYTMQERVGWVSARADVNAVSKEATVTLRFDATLVR